MEIKTFQKKIFSNRGIITDDCLIPKKLKKAMKLGFKTIMMISAMLISASAVAQEIESDETDRERDNQIQTVFKGGPRSVTGYGALTNKFTTIRGDFANLTGVYGGVFINHKLMIGVGAAALTNTLEVPLQYSADPLRDMNYEYGQVGLVTEYVMGSNKAIHLAFNLFSGAGFTVQNDRDHWDDDWDDDDFDWENNDNTRDTNWFFVVEPGVQLEVNVLRWMRFSPGISYRAAFGSDGLGMRDSDISNISYNATLKFGRF
jgi:hypothetical protein